MKDSMRIDIVMNLENGKDPSQHFSDASTIYPSRRSQTLINHKISSKNCPSRTILVSVPMVSISENSKQQQKGI
jgi:hypothetical protein